MKVKILCCNATSADQVILHQPFGVDIEENEHRWWTYYGGAIDQTGVYMYRGRAIVSWADGNICVDM